jgi:ribonuclease Z
VRTIILAFAGALALNAQSPALDDGGLHVLLCGTGSPLADSARAGACIAIYAGGQMILIDSGPGSWRNLRQWPAQSLTAVFLTHFHSDHIGGLGEALVQSWIAGRAKPLDVYGPEGVENVAEGFTRAYSLDAGYRTAHHGADHLPPAAEVAVGHPVRIPRPDERVPVFDRDGLRVFAFLVAHDPVKPAFGYRVEYAGRAVVASGDTSYSANLVRHAQGADLLLHDNLNPALINLASANLQSQGRTRQSKMLRDTLSYHATPAEAARSAAEARVGQLVLFHCVPPPTTPQMEQALIATATAAFTGKVSVAHDGDVFDLPRK